MFPEIVRDEVFRLETRRLWLRWPTVADAFDGANGAAKAMNQTAGTSGITPPGPACIAAWRAATESGEALHLMLEAKSSRLVVGSLHLTVAAERQACLRFQLAPVHCGRGLMTEAVRASVHMAFLLGVAPTIQASVPGDDRCDRRVLERSGFIRVDARVADGDGRAARDGFKLDRSDWASFYTGREGQLTTGHRPSPPSAAWLTMAV